MWEHSDSPHPVGARYGEPLLAGTRSADHHGAVMHGADPFLHGRTSIAPRLRGPNRKETCGAGAGSISWPFEN